MDTLLNFEIQIHTVTLLKCQIQIHSRNINVHYFVNSTLTDNIWEFRGSGSGAVQKCTVLITSVKNGGNGDDCKESDEEQSDCFRS